MEKPRHPVERIALDVDETIADVMNHVLSLHNLEKSARFTMDDITDWKWTSIGITGAEFRKHYSTVWHTMTEQIGLLINKELLLELSKYYEIDLVTKRGGIKELEETAEPLKKWLIRHGIDKYRLVLSGHGVEKDVLRYDIYIDDSPILAERIESCKGKKMFLVTQPHNRNYAIKSRKVVRVADANDALRRLLKKAKSGLKHKRV